MFGFQVCLDCLRCHIVHHIKHWFEPSFRQICYILIERLHNSFILGIIYWCGQTFGGHPVIHDEEYLNSIDWSDWGVTCQISIYCAILIVYVSHTQKYLICLLLLPRWVYISVLLNFFECLFHLLVRWPAPDVSYDHCPFPGTSQGGIFQLLLPWGLATCSDGYSWWTWLGFN